MLRCVCGCLCCVLVCALLFVLWCGAMCVLASFGGVSFVLCVVVCWCGGCVGVVGRCGACLLVVLVVCGVLLLCCVMLCVNGCV